MTFFSHVKPKNLKIDAENVFENCREPENMQIRQEYGYLSVKQSLGLITYACLPYSRRWSDFLIGLKWES